MYYTYIHIREDTNEIFYVGKGSNNRLNCKHDRNNYWRNFTNKYKWRAEILSYWETEDDAFSHEKLIIQSLQDIGCRLVNISMGGCLYDSPPLHVKRAVVCLNNGKVFDSVTSAASWLRNKGFPRIGNNSISKCATYGKEYYGWSFRYVDNPETIEHPYKLKEYKKVPIFTSNTGEPHITWTERDRNFVVNFSKEKVHKYFSVHNYGTKEEAFAAAIEYKYSIYDTVLVNVPNKDEHFPMRSICNG